MKQMHFLKFAAIQMAFMGFFVLASAAQNYTLTTTADTHAASPTTSPLDAGGQVSLRSAMEASTQIAGTHIITIPAAIGTTINLTLGQMTVGNAAVGNNITVNGPGMALLTVNQTTDNRVFSTGTGAVTFNLRDLTLNCTAPGSTSYSGGGGAFIAGGLGATTTLRSVTISNFRSQIGNGGAFSQSSSLNAHSLYVTNCTFINNRCGGAGGAVSFNSQGGMALITHCTFISNQTGVVGANTGGDGGALSTTGGGSGGTYLVENNTFVGNQVENNTGHGGAVINVNGTLTLRYNRLVGNTCANVTNPPLANVVAQAGGATIHATLADNNWWGVNTGPGANDAAVLAAGGTMTLVNWLQLRHSANPNPIRTNGVTTLTATFLTNSAGAAIALGNIRPLIGLPIAFTNARLGVLSGAQATIQSSGNATVIYTAGATGGIASANAIVDSGTSTATFVVQQQPSFTICQPNISSNSNTGVCGAIATFNSSVTGYPPPVVSYSPASGSLFPTGKTIVVATATNGVLPNATCSFTVTVVDVEAPIMFCPANITTNTDTNTCSATLNPGPATALDNCNTATVVGVRADLLPLNSPYPKGTNIIIWTATDSVGNTSSCPQTVIVRDQQKPVVTCPSDVIAIEDPKGSGSALVRFYDAGASDNCPGFSAPVATPASGSTFPIGTNIVTNIVTDLSGNTSTCKFFVIVRPATNAAFRIIGVVPQTNDLLVTWATPGGRTNALQFTIGGPAGSYTDNFADVIGATQFLIAPLGDTTTNFLINGGFTSSPARYYRVRSSK